MLSSVRHHYDLLITAAQLSRSAYAFAKGRTGVFGGSRFSKLHTFETGNASGFVAVEDDDARIWCVFAGTDEIQDWSENASCAQVPLMNSSVIEAHSGFVAHHEKVLADYETVIAKLESETGITRTTFAGHSLGGAVATLAAAFAYCDGLNCEAITIGAPRVFPPKSAYYLNHVEQLPVTRIESITDWIPDLPPRLGRTKYDHIGRPIYIDDNGRITQEDRPLVAKALLWWRRLRRKKHAPDVHSSGEYVRRLKAAALTNEL